MAEKKFDKYLVEIEGNNFAYPYKKIITKNKAEGIKEAKESKDKYCKDNKDRQTFNIWLYGHKKGESDVVSYFIKNQKLKNPYFDKKTEEYKPKKMR